MLIDLFSQNLLAFDFFSLDSKRKLRTRSAQDLKGHLMGNQKQGRGRPKGDGANDDAILRAIAEQLARDPRTKPAQAMRAYCDKNGRGRPTDTERRRWHAKWHARGPKFLAQAERSWAETQAEKAKVRIQNQFALASTAAHKLNQTIGSFSMPEFPDHLKKITRASRSLSQAFDATLLESFLSVQKQILQDSGLFNPIFFFALMQKRNKKDQGCIKKAKN